MLTEEKIVVSILSAFGIAAFGIVTYTAGKSKGYEEGYDKADTFWKENTPEDQIRAINQAKEEQVQALEKATMEKNQAAELLADQKLKSDAAYERLVKTKKEYQAEIRPELEAKVRKELETYISEADVKYAKAEKTLQEAKRENEMTKLRLELMKEYKKDTNVPIIFSSGEAGYGDAVAAISASSMSSYDKKLAIQGLEDDRDAEYYKATIGIAKSNMSSSDRALAIQAL